MDLDKWILRVDSKASVEKFKISSLKVSSKTMSSMAGDVSSMTKASIGVSSREVLGMVTESGLPIPVNVKKGIGKWERSNETYINDANSIVGHRT